MFSCTVFAFSAVGLIRKVPLQKSALMTIALLCTLRGLLAIPTFVTPSGFDIWQIVASTIDLLNQSYSKRFNAWTNKAWLGSCPTNYCQALLARYAKRYIYRDYE
ncbi:hypothetical protein [Pseudoalteromonas luteoviolacea]|uniref:hypothetical protein n=1 Tax=Pseudoalteromonas luteoviolacea TaxID=43657 RepID=UPI000AAF9A6B|nr:hypothetical protein [Pseudoalteromonas luteoviolacea]